MAQIQQPTPQQNAQKAMSANLAARQSVLSQGFPMLQSIYSANINPSTQTILNIPPQNVGLIKGFLVEIVASYTVAATTALAITPFGPANLLQNVTFQDLQNYQRINTYGWHIAFLNSARQGRPFFSSTPSNDPIGYGANWAVVDTGTATGQWPAAPAASTSYVSRFFYWIPLTYSHSDLTGGIYAGVVNATMNLQLTLATSAQFAVASGDPALAVYSGNTATVTNYAVTVYQSYIDQLPVGQNGAPALPFIDLNTIYELKQTPFQSIAASADNYFGYSNFRHFMSTTLFYDNGSSWPSIVPGSDINYFSFRTANFTDTRKADPYVWAAFNRQKILTDTPKQVYYFDHRDKPIYTTQTGNTNLVMNPSTVNTSATVTIGWEMLANVTNLINAGSLAANS
jgi:hypothetical protein